MTDDSVSVMTLDIEV